MTFAYPYFQVQFNKEGTVFKQSEVDAVVNAISAAEGAPTDLFIMCHGWNNNIDDATNLYEALTGLIKTQADASPQLTGRRYAVCGLLWPAKKFEDTDLIPSGAAALNDAVTTDQLKQRVDDLCSLYAASEWPEVAIPAPAAFDQIKSMMDQIENLPENQTSVVDLLRSLLPQDAATGDDASLRFFQLSPEALVDKLSTSLTPPPIEAGAGAASIAELDPFQSGTTSGLGGAASFRDVLGGIKSGILHLLNYTTYYLMKARAGDVGAKGEAPLIVKLRDTRPDLRVHMIGHSFGCRATAASINALPSDEKYRSDTVFLLQGAFSHNGFAEPSVVPMVERGAFRDVIANKKVRGPILISHTRNDKAVGIAYSIASRLSGVTAAALGDANDIYGGLGSNGTQTPTTTKEGVAGELLPVGGSYPFAAGVKATTPYNLKADKFIGDHSDIRKPEVGYALCVGMAAPRVS